MAAVFDHFLDFDRSLADQRTMAEFSACLVLLTWLAPAFDVLPYAWPNGGWGNGKTKWLTCWALAGHMGEVTTMAATLSTVPTWPSWARPWGSTTRSAWSTPSARPTPGCRRSASCSWPATARG